MKKAIIIGFGSALLGGLAAIGGARVSGLLEPSSNFVSMAPGFRGTAQFASLDAPGTATGELNFTTAASKTLPVVVNIQTAERLHDQGGSFPGGGFNLQDIPAPFRQFFNLPDTGPRPKRNNKGDDGADESVQMGTGSGVIISPDGYIVTNNHVLAGADELTVTLNDKRSYKAKVIGADPSTDLGLLKIDAENLPFVNFSNSDAVKVGEWVLAVGNPFNLTSTVTAGIVSAKGRDIHILQDQAPIESFIQTDAAINPGNSGGALVNLNGDLIGINAAIASPTGAYAGYGFAIPANIVAKVVDDLKKYGVAQRGYLGAVIREIDADFAKKHDLGALNEGVYVDSLAENSAAGAAGIRKGDVIVKIEDQPIRTSADLLETVGRHRPGDQLSIGVLRNGAARNYQVTLKNKQGNTSAVRKSEASGLTAVLGAEFKTVTPAEARKLGIAGGVQVVQLGKGKIANQTDLEEGFVITKVDGKAVETVESLTGILAGRQGGVMLEGIYPDRPGTFYYAFGM